MKSTIEYILIMLIILPLGISVGHYRAALQVEQARNRNCVANQELLAETAIVATMRYEKARQQGFYDGLSQEERSARLHKSIEQDFNAGKVAEDYFHFSQ